MLQILEANRRAVVCVNLMDEAKKKSISIRFDVLEERLGVPVIGTAARSGKGLEQIYEGLKHVLELNKRLESARNMEVVEGEYAETEAVDVAVSYTHLDRPDDRFRCGQYILSEFQQTGGRHTEGV